MSENAQREYVHCGCGALCHAAGLMAYIPAGQSKRQYLDRLPIDRPEPVPPPSPNSDKEGP